MNPNFGCLIVNDSVIAYRRDGLFLAGGSVRSVGSLAFGIWLCCFGGSDIFVFVLLFIIVAA